MAGENIYFPNFRDEQADSRYPFADYASLQSNNSEKTISKDMFVDASFYPIGGGGTIYVSNILVAFDKVTITARTTAPIVSVTGSYNPLSLPESNTIFFYDEHNRPAGILLFNKARLLEIYQWGFGTYAFSRAATEIAATAFVPALEPGVRALTLNGQGFLSGDIWLVGDKGVVLSVEDENVIRVDTVGVPLFTRAACDDAGKNKPSPRFVSTINGCSADEFGNFTLTATDRGITGNDTTVLRVYPTDYGLVIEAAGRSEI